MGFLTDIERRGETVMKNSTNGAEDKTEVKRSHVLSPRRVINGAMRIFDVIRKDRLNAYAAESAFFVMLSAIPLLTLTVTVAGIVIPESVSEYIHRLASFVPGILGDYIEEEFLSFLNYPAPAPLSISAFALLWSASRGVRAVRRGVRSVWGRGSDSMLSEMLHGIAFTAMFILIIVAILVFFVFGDALSSFVSAQLESAGRVFDHIVDFSPVFTLVLLVMFFVLMLHAFTPKDAARTHIRNDLPGAALASAGWTLYSFLFSVFISDFSNMPHIYGSAAAVMILMLWLYMSMYILLLGAEVNKFFLERKRLGTK